MARKSSDSSSSPEPLVGSVAGRDAPAFVVAPDTTFLEGAVSDGMRLPAGCRQYASIPDLSRALSELSRLPIAFVVIASPDGNAIDIHALRELRLDFPQLIILTVLGECDQRSLLRLQSVGVHATLLPPFSAIDLAREMATTVPNVPQFKRHPDLMRRGQARLDYLIPSDLSYVLGVNYEVALLLKEFGFPAQDVRVNIPLACDEAITNAIVHGNGSDPEKKVNIQIYVSHSRFRIRVRDQGRGFDADAVADPLEGENVMRSGGRGVYLMRKIMDSVEYREEGRVLELEKRNTNAPDNGLANGNGES